MTSLCAPIAATAATGLDLPGSLISCMDRSDSLERLVCYDREMEQLTSTAMQKSSAVRDDRTPASDGGITVSVPEKRQGNGDGKGQQEQQDGGLPPQRSDLTATIVKISKRRYGERIITLDNGQLWVEKIPTPSMILNVGNVISIRQGRFGGYRLSGRGNRSTEVTLIR